ncbi:hypothetical protein VTL71DRAFT_7402 [Oculimacula yallundae]|uniref:Uncharacterized protein n=1 Tax=Oculimacula yallundae TaxID=86028 RepID=A0ABR4BVP2_9HELO
MPRISPTISIGVRIAILPLNDSALPYLQRRIRDAYSITVFRKLASGKCRVLLLGGFVGKVEQMEYTSEDECLETSLRWISIIVAFTCMIAIQYLLLKIHHLRKVLPSEGIPTNAEVWIGVAAFWILHRVLEESGRVVFGAVLGIFPDRLAASENLKFISKTSTLIRSLIESVVISWILHQSIIVLLDIIPPLTRNPRWNPYSELASIRSRMSHVLTFICNMIFGAPAIPTHIPLKILIQDTKSRSTTQTVRLQRVQRNHPNEGQRILAWNLVVDKEALDEMKETLGPPGGFGELGFSVGADGIRFEAMGVGTSFVLDFEVLTANEQRGITVRRKMT